MLCTTNNLKSGKVLFQNIVTHIVQDLKKLEETGIEISPQQFLKGTIMNTSHDNLGANNLFGFVECFVATYPCRLCECDRNTMQKLFVEDTQLMRRNETYDQHIRELDQAQNDNLNVKGVKKNAD